MSATPGPSEHVSNRTMVESDSWGRLAAVTNPC